MKKGRGFVVLFVEKREKENLVKRLVNAFLRGTANMKLETVKYQGP